MQDEELAACYGDEGSRLLQVFRMCFSETIEKLEKLNKYHIQSLLISGSSGSGKTYIFEKLAQLFNVQFLKICLGEFAANFPGRFEIGLENWFSVAANKAPCVLLVKDIDLLFPKKNREFAAAYRFVELVSQNSRDRKQFLMVATTQKPSNIDPYVVKCFKETITLEIPLPEHRAIILKRLINTSKFQNIRIEDITDKCHGFSPADLETLNRLAEENAYRRGNINTITVEDYLSAIPLINVSTSYKRAPERPAPIRWHDIGGLEEVKNSLEESVIWIYKHAEAYRRLGITPSKGILLYGAPGTGKTLLAKAVATESSATFLPVSIAEIVKGEVGESEKAIMNIFSAANRCAPCILFLDELEAIFGRRSDSGELAKKLVSQFLLELDGVRQGVVVLGATNYPEAIDRSILRAGRLDRLIYVPPPTITERASILRIIATDQPWNDSLDLDSIAKKTANFTGADLRALVRKAGLLAIKRCRADGLPLAEARITERDFLDGLNSVKPSVSIEEESRYLFFEKSFA